jgi:small subunit ribosomal protein S4e
MARGPKKHLKRLNAPKHWMLNKMGGVWAPRPSTGPHKLRECLPMSLVLRQRLKYALTRREVMMICMRRLVQVDGKARTDHNYPCGFMDVLSIPSSEEHFRLLYDTKGRFILHKIKAEEAKYKLCRVVKVAKANKTTIGYNREMNGQQQSIPYVTTHDGRTMKYPDPDIKVNDTVKFDLTTGKIVAHMKFEAGMNVMVTRGKNQGRIGVVVNVERHPGSFDIVHIRDKKNENFATRLENVFVIGESKGSWITIPRGKGIKLSIFQEKEEREKPKKKSSKK